MFVLSSDITIGNFRFSGVYEVCIKRSMHSIADNAIIKLPSIGKIASKNKTLAETITTGKKFRDGDPVTIKLGYNGILQTEFRGFVNHRSLAMPLTISCDGYGWLLRRNSVKIFAKVITVENLLLKAVDQLERGYKIKIRCTVDFKLTNVQIPGCSGFEVITNIIKYTDGCLTCFFIEPDVLWCGFVYSLVSRGRDMFKSGMVDYKLGYNVINDNDLKERSVENDPVEVTYSSKLASGEKCSGVSDTRNGIARTYNRILNQVKDATALKELAIEKAEKLNYSGYEGSIVGFLEPYAAPGATASIADVRYPERNGKYLIESTEVRFGVNGARRIVEIGPMMGIAK